MIARLRARPPRPPDRGAVLIVVLLVMMVLLSLGMVSLWLTTGNMKIAASMSLRAQTLYCAEAGLERAKAVLNAGPPNNIPPFLTAMLPGTGIALDDVPAAVDAAGKPTGLGAVFIDNGVALAGIAFPPPSFQRGGGTTEAPQSTRMGNYTVWIRNDLTDLRDGNFVVDTNSAVVIRSQCVAPDGRTTAAVEVTFVPPIKPPTINMISECLDSGKNVDDANTNTLHCSRGS
jgi:PilX N-terminal